MIANHGPQTEPWRSLRLRQTGQHSGVDRPAKAVDTGKYRTDRECNRSGFPKRDPERFYVDHDCKQGYVYGADGKLAEVDNALWSITDEAGAAVDTLSDGTLYELRVSVADGSAFDLSEAEKEIKISVVLAK